MSAREIINSIPGFVKHKIKSVCRLISSYPNCIFFLFNRYAKTWLTIDLISSIPFDNVILMVTGGDSDSYGLGVKSAFRGFKFLRLVKLLSLLKLLRLSRILRFVSKYEDVSGLFCSGGHI